MNTMQSFWKLAIVTAAVFITSCSDEESNIAATPDTNATETMMREGGNNPDEAVFDDLSAPRDYLGYVYVAGNELGHNEIYIFKHNQDGNLTFKGMVASGGGGNGLALNSQGAIVISADKKYLFVVNSGSNSISSFKIDAQGDLALAHTISSGGVTPVSLAINDNRLYVVNSGDGTISGFMYDEAGKLLPIENSLQHLSSPSVGPAQIAFSPSGRYLYVTEKRSNKVSILSVRSNGVAMPVASMNSVGTAPSGVEMVRNGYMLVANSDMGAPNGSSLTSYGGSELGILSELSGKIPSGQTDGSWIAATDHGRFAYVSNYGSSNLSSYYISSSGSIHLAQANIESGRSPSDITIASNNYNVFVLSPKDHSIYEYVRTPLGGLRVVGKYVNMPESAAGIASW
jgi:6-phosphogluconolactonase